MITIVADTMGISFRKIADIVSTAFRRMGFISSTYLDYRVPVIGKSQLVVLIGDSVTSTRIGIHRVCSHYADKRIWWTDTPLDLDLIPDREVDFINDYWCIAVCARSEVKRFAERGFKVCSVIGRPINEIVIENVRRSNDNRYRKQYGKYILVISSDMIYPPHVKYPRKGLDRFDEAIGLIKPFLKERGIKVIAITNWSLKNVDVTLRAGTIGEEDLYQLIKQSLLFVFPSRREGFGLPPLEAMSLGKLVVYTDVPTHNEFTIGIPVEADYEEVYEEIPAYGFKWSLYDYKARDLADTIAYAVDLIERDPQYVEKIVEKALKKAREFYSIKIASKLYDMVI